MICSQVSLECHEKSNAKHRYEFIYKSKSPQIEVKLKDVQYPDVDKILADINTIPDEKSLPELKEGQQLTREIVSEESLRDHTNDKKGFALK